MSSWPFVATALAVAAIYLSRRAKGFGSTLLLLLGLDAIILSLGQVIRELDELVSLWPFVVSSISLAVICISALWRGWLPRIVLPLCVAVIFICCWQLSCELKSYISTPRSGVPRLIEVFPKPWAVLIESRQPLMDGALLKFAVASLFRVACGFGLAAAIGIPFGLWVGWSSRAAWAFNPLIQGLRPISPIAWIPLAILWFGVKDGSCIFLITLASFFPIVTGTMAAVRTIPLVYVRSAQNFGLERLELFRRVVLPACLPQIIISLRIALGIAWLVIVAAEMIAVDSGLGYLITDSRNASNYERVIAGMIAIGILGVGLDVLVRRLELFDEVRWGFPNANVAKEPV